MPQRARLHRLPAPRNPASSAHPSHGPSEPHCPPGKRGNRWPQRRERLDQLIDEFHLAPSSNGRFFSSPGGERAAVSGQSPGVGQGAPLPALDEPICGV